MPDLAVFSSWRGRVNDSPRAIFDELRRRGADLRYAWIVAPETTKLPDDVEVVEAGTAAEAEALAQARWIVSNDVLQPAFAKAPGATYLQTWHGTPLKRIAFDVERPTFPQARFHYDVELGRDVARWDALLSPNAYSSEILPRAFRYRGPLLETGYPRNDALVAPGRDTLRTQVREALGVDSQTKVVLYAPTWRDRFAFELALDLDALAAALGEAVVLVRAHWLAARGHPGGVLADTARVRDVSRWPEVGELYLAADVLVTDYSSAMFDFALTGRPIFLYAYDLEHYRDELRGFYVDLEEIAPGPIVRDAEALVAALADLDAVAADHAGAHRVLRERFCHRDDGRAAARVVDAVFASVAPPDPSPPLDLTPS